MRLTMMRVGLLVLVLVAVASLADARPVLRCFDNGECAVVDFGWWDSLSWFFSLKEWW